MGLVFSRREGYSLTDTVTSGSTESLFRQQMSSDNNETEAEKRKLVGNDVSGRRKKTREDNGVQTIVREDEVEEFFAILRRIRVAVKYFEKANGDGSKLTVEKSRLRAVLEREGGEEVNGVKGEVKREEGVKENVGFDLNAIPDSEEDPI